MKIQTKCICLLFGLLILTSCNEKTDLIKPDCGINSEHFNNEITIVPFDKLNSYKINDSITLTIFLHNNELVVTAPINFNTQLFVYDEIEKKWLGVENDILYWGDPPRLDSKNDRGYFSVNPSFLTDKKRVEVYLCISGEIDGDINQKVGASYLFTLHK
jgi:hypothetical protein